MKTIESKVKIRKREKKLAIIAAYKAVKKNPKNSIGEWIKRTALEYDLSEETIKGYIYRKS